MSHLCGRRLPRQTAEHGRRQKAIAGQIARRCRSRNAGRRATGREQIWKHYSVLVLDAAGAINRETALGMKQRAGDLDCMERRQTFLLRRELSAVTLSTAVCLERFNFRPFRSESRGRNMHRMRNRLDAVRVQHRTGPLGIAEILELPRH